MRQAAILLFPLALAFGCGHAKTTETPAAEPSAEKPPAHHGTERPAAENPKSSKKTPVVESPEGLLKPGAEKEIRQKLAAEGFLADEDKGSLAGGLRKFQKAHDLPATGTADQETVRKLGLDPAHIFRRAEPSP